MTSPSPSSPHLLITAPDLFSGTLPTITETPADAWKNLLSFRNLSAAALLLGLNQFSNTWASSPIRTLPHADPVHHEQDPGERGQRCARLRQRVWPG